MEHMKIPLIVFIAIKRYPGEKAAGGHLKSGTRHDETMGSCFKSPAAHPAFFDFFLFPCEKSENNLFQMCDMNLRSKS